MPDEPQPNVEPAQTCGVIMPISSTASHDAAHWAKVQLLLHRAIEEAKLTPRNVWHKVGTDRITTRILSNIFADPIAVCDITDFNANVMVELGLRLSSKKPTVVVQEDGAKPPFDIADFKVIFYPANLSILEMEAFLAELRAELVEKLKAVADGNYTPFLAGIHVETLEPTREIVPFNDLVVRQLEDISYRLSQVESQSSDRRSKSNRMSWVEITLTPPATVEEMQAIFNVVGVAGVGGLPGGAVRVNFSDLYNHRATWDGIHKAVPRISNGEIRYE